MMRLFYMESGGSNGHDAARALLKSSYRLCFGSGIPDIEIMPGGKPYFPSKPDVYFSLSHTDGHVLCAISDAYVGCDIQIERPVLARLPQRVCSERELETLSFFELWVLKESYIKLRGGLSGKLRDICFIRTDGHISTPEPGVEAALYPRVGGCFIGACRSGGGLAECVETVQS